MKNALRTSLLTVFFLLAFAFSAIAGDKQPNSHHLNCPVNASAGKSAKVHTTHIRKKGKPKKHAAQKPKQAKQKTSKQKATKVKKEKTANAPKQKTAKVKKEKSRDIQQQKAPKTKAAKPKNTNKNYGSQHKSRSHRSRAVMY